ncbi:glycoside hydrolase [Thozetella sp. PMI_491]|nr:glycoside hydrolase [Thozetella sp. PMI_491]
MRGSQLLAAAALAGAGHAASNSTGSDTAILSSGYGKYLRIDLGVYADAYEKAKAFVATLNNTQKVAIITGQSIDGEWTALKNKDGVSGINYQFYVSGFSMANALTMTWDRQHFEAQFKAVGDEFYGMGYNLINGPECGPLGRTPWGGRQPEAFSPDPYLTGIAMGKAIAGQNSAGVIAAGRHFLLNEQETNRSAGLSASTTTVYSSSTDDKTTHELYLWPFADGVNAGMGAVMCSMNRINDTLSCENSASLSGLLKTELGFPGLVLPDVNSQATAYGSANAGLDYGSGSLWTETVLEAGIANGSFTQERLDDMAIRNVIGYYYVGLDDGQQPSQASSTEYRDVRGNHSALIRTIAAESLVLLKNDNTGGRGLPLSNPRTLSIFGAHAGASLAGPNHGFSVQGNGSPTYDGHLVSGSGSGQLSLPYLITPQSALTMRVATDGGMIWWITNDTYSSTSSSGGFGGGGGAPTGGNGTGNGTTGGGGGGGGAGGMNLGNLGSGTASSPSFTNYAANSAACLVFLNAYSGEGADRTELYNADQDTMVATVAASCNNTIVVINTVGPRLVDQWIENDNITAVLYGGLLGQESGNAIADVLYGDVNPSGKLTNTIAKNESDYPVSICYTADCDFTEAGLIDYRWFDAKNITPRYEFGYGLSYTTFTYGDVSAVATNSSALSSTYSTGRTILGGSADLWDEVITVSTAIQNSGSVAGAEVAQLYVGFPDEAGQATQVLRGFEKTAVLAAGESADVTFSVRRRDVSYWDVAAQQWAVAKGTYTFAVGASSRDTRGEATLTI